MFFVRVLYSTLMSRYLSCPEVALRGFGMAINGQEKESKSKLDFAAEPLMTANCQNTARLV